MSREKTYGKNDLVESYFKCPLFKKYCQYNFWFGSFNEYNNIKYCKKYINQYIRLSIENFILQHFSLSILFVLYSSPRFTKFVESGFFKYLNFHFLLLFYNNCFNCSLKDKKLIEKFVHEYFKIYVKNHLKQDLLICINKSLHELSSNSFKLHLTNCIKHGCIDTKVFLLNRKVFFKVIVHTFDKNNVEKSPLFTNYLIKNLFSNISFFNTRQICVKSFNFQRYLYNRKLKISLFNGILFKLGLEKNYLFFIENNFIKLYKDIQNLSERLEVLSVFYIRFKSLGLYKNYNIVFDDHLYYRSFKSNRSLKNFNRLLKSFNSCFNTNQDKT